MVRVTIKKGDWQNFAKDVDLIHEKCGNKKCVQNKNNMIMFYPYWYMSPGCNKCNTKLHGSKLYNHSRHRVNYHLTGTT